MLPLALYMTHCTLQINSYLLPQYFKRCVLRAGERGLRVMAALPDQWLIPEPTWRLKTYCNSCSRISGVLSGPKDITYMWYIGILQAKHPYTYLHKKRWIWDKWAKKPHLWGLVDFLISSYPQEIETPKFRKFIWVSVLIQQMLISWQSNSVSTSHNCETFVSDTKLVL